jgi:S1-C subfamily serine protease
MMRFVLPCWLLAALGVASAQEDAPGLKEAEALQRAVQGAIQKAEPAIVCILVSRSEDYRQLGQTPPDNDAGKLGGFVPPNTIRSPEDEESKRLRALDLENPLVVPESFGSGIVIDDSGLILTCEHVIRGATKVFVRLPGRQGSYADIHAADPRSDLAVLRLLKPPPGLKALKLGDGGTLKKGQWIVTLANPYAAGFRDGSPSASWGIVSNLRRRLPGSPVETERSKTLHEHGTLIQTDARLNLGTSGGALLDLRGELVGLTTSLAAVGGSETAGGFAVPLNAGMRRIIEVLRRGEEVEYGFLGVGLKASERRPRGLAIERVTPGSPAARAGLIGEDIILSIDGMPIHDNDDLLLAVGMILAGGKAQIEYQRNSGSPVRTASVTLAKSYVPGKVIAANKPPLTRGLRVEQTSVLLTMPQGAASVLPGVLVREVHPDSKASLHLKVHDIITHVNGRPVNAPDEFYREMQRATGPVELRLESRNVTIP